MNISTLDILYFSLSIGFLLFVGYFAFLVVKISHILNSIKILIDDVDDTAKDIRAFKNKAKSNAFKIISTVAGLILAKRR